jgi:hypothetical protein
MKQWLLHHNEHHQRQQQLLQGSNEKQIKSKQHQQQQQPHQQHQRHQQHLRLRALLPQSLRHTIHPLASAGLKSADRSLRVSDLTSQTSSGRCVALSPGANAAQSFAPFAQSGIGEARVIAGGFDERDDDHGACKMGGDDQQQQQQHSRANQALEHLDDFLQVQHFASAPHGNNCAPHQLH